MEPKSENTATSGKNLNEGTILKILLPFQLVYASASFYIFSLELVFSFFVVYMIEYVAMNIL